MLWENVSWHRAAVEKIGDEVQGDNLGELKSEHLHQWAVLLNKWYQVSLILILLLQRENIIDSY